jgi:membrane protein DedA with SNARE-associated domain
MGHPDCAAVAIRPPGVVIYLGWTLGNGTDVPTSGYAAMALGVIFSLAVGFGLMALLFYSSRKGYDEPPVLIAPEYDAMESKRRS